VLGVYELTWRGHATARHAHGHRVQSVEAVAHAGWEVTILRVWRCLLEGAELVLALIFLFFAAVTAVRALGAIAALVGTTMSKIKTLVSSKLPT